MIKMSDLTATAKKISIGLFYSSAEITKLENVRFGLKKEVKCPHCGPLSSLRLGMFFSTTLFYEVHGQRCHFLALYQTAALYGPALLSSLHPTRS